MIRHNRSHAAKHFSWDNFSKNSLSCYFPIINTYVIFHVLDPNCTHGIRQNMSCNYVSQEIMDHQEAKQECNRLNLYSQKEYRIPLLNVKWNSLTNDSLIWIGQQQKPSTKNFAGKNSEEKSHESTTVSDENLSIYSQCNLWKGIDDKTVRK